MTTNFVWVYWNGGQKDELRWSIRSVLKNFQGNARITVVGDKPDWYCGHHINVPQVKVKHYPSFRNSLNKLIEASEHSDVDEEFVWMMDDVYIVQPTTLNDLRTPRRSGMYRENMLDKWRTGNVWQRLKKKTVLEIGSFPVYDYSTHLPHCVTKDNLKFIVDKYELKRQVLIWELIYGHHFYKKSIDYRPFFSRISRKKTYEELQKITAKASVINNTEGAWREPLRALLYDTFTEMTDVETKPPVGLKKQFRKSNRVVKETMMPKASINVVAVIPWRSQPDRKRGYRWVKEYLSNMCNRVVTGDSSGEIFNRSQAINNAVRGLSISDSTILAIVDSDCFITKKRFREGVREAFESRKLVIPHDCVCRMNHKQSREVYDNYCPTKGPKGTWFRKTRSKHCVSGIVMIRYDSFKKVNGYDESFVGWGGEDNAFKISCDMILSAPEQDVGGVVRLDGPLFHFWHRKEEYQNTKQFKLNDIRYQEDYRPHDLDKILALVQENGYHKPSVEV